MGFQPRRGSHAAALIAFGCDWTEVSLSPCADRRAPIARSVLGTALYRSVVNQSYGIFRVKARSAIAPCLSGL